MAGKNMKKGLGKGLGALIPAAETAKKKTDAQSDNGFVELDITKIEPNKDQPRKKFDEDALEELADSIKEKGLLQPITVSPKGDRYQIVMGERRWRAARKAGLKKVPVVVRKDLTEQDIAELSLIENIQREDLNPIEEALAYKKLLEDYHLKQDDVAERVSKSRTAVTNSMRLLKLTEEVQQMVIDDKISTGHARALITIEDPELQKELAERIFDERMSVRDIEKEVKKIMGPKKLKKALEKNERLDAVYRDLEERLKQAVGTKVVIDGKGDGSGKMSIAFYNNDDLEKIINRLLQA
ncbi:MAG: ParB/RepB/Spo0J family partition protein [Lachnospiraceae bacterium]|nr:ParB/RepB/Spo0J family partition protein [Lachnospiraceae bacterium]